MTAIRRISAAQRGGKAAGGRGERSEGRTRRRLAVVLAASALATLAVGQAQGASLSTLASFDFAHGAFPYAPLLADAAGNLIGTTQNGGATENGTIFAIKKDPSSATGYASAPSVLYYFDRTHGTFPQGNLLTDADGNLFGTTEYGGATGQGTVFELKKDASSATGYASGVTTLFGFDGNFGAQPEAGLFADKAGNILGTTSLGSSGSLCPEGCGSAFELVKTSSGYTPYRLFAFDGGRGAGPQAGLIADAAGNLFGTTPTGNAVASYGTVFEIAKNASGYDSYPIVLFRFDGTHGARPLAGLLADAAGNLFGTTSQGGAGNLGTVYEIPRTSTGYASTPIVLFSFDGAHGAGPYAGLIADAAGNLFGTTRDGGAAGKGTVFELKKDPSSTTGYAATPTVLVSFNPGTGTDGANPQAGLLADKAGNLYGTTYNGGALGYGTVFKVTGSGFVTSTVFAGTPGQASCHDDTVSALAQQNRGMNRAATALGYGSVKDLQSAITAYCGG